MKFAVVGAGGVGGYFGARLAAAGYPVTFLVRGGQRQAMVEAGLQVLSASGDLHLARPEVYESPEATGVCDVVLLCVKLWDLAAAAAAVRPLVTPDSAVVPLQNGVEAMDTVAAVLGPHCVLGGVAYIAAAVERPGVIRHVGTVARLIFGERDGFPSWRQEGLLAACAAAGIEARASSAITVDIWDKFVFLAPLAGATARFRCPVGEVMAEPRRRACFEAMVYEAAAVGRALGVDLAPDLEGRCIAIAAGLPPETRTSMLNDLINGRRLELDWLNGAVVRLGRELAVATPEHAAAYEELRFYALGAEP